MAAGLRLAGFPLEVEDAVLRFEKRGRGDRDVWTRGMAGQVMETVQWATPGGRLAERMGPMGFLARELPGEIPALMRGV